MAHIDQYLLGYRQAEQEQLQRQAEMLGDEARGLFDRIGVFAGARVVEIGCGPQGTLKLLAERVGPRGTVTGVERSEEAVLLAREFVVDHKLDNVDVIHSDGRKTGLPRGAFDLATVRSVLVNVPQPEQIVAEMAELVRPGGIVALYESDYSGFICDPPLPAWDEVIDLLRTYSSRNGIDPFIGRKISRLLREAGLIDIQVVPIVRNSPQGHVHRTLLPHFAENLRERLVAQKIVGNDELDDLISKLRCHLDDPHTLVMGGLFFQAWGRRPVRYKWPLVKYINCVVSAERLK